MKTTNQMSEATIGSHKPVGEKTYLQRLVLNMKFNGALYVFVLPAIILIFIFNYIPMYGVQIAFRDFVPTKGFMGSQWVGLKHFYRFFDSFQFWSLIRNTIGISFYQLVIGFPFPIILALALNQLKNKRFRGLVQTVSYAPHFISVVVVVGMLLVFLSPTSGLISNIIRLFGGNPIDLMGEASWFRTLYVFSDVWQHAGWDSIIYFAALAAVDVQLYDAAEVDGVNKWQRIYYIELPSLLPTIVILLILRAGSIMSIGFEKVFLMQNSLNLGVSEIISTYVYKVGLISSQYSYSAAIGLFNTVINFILLMVVNVISKKLGEVSLW